MSAAAPFHEPARVPCPWCDGQVSCELDDQGEPILSHQPEPCSKFAGAREAQLLRACAQAVRRAPFVADDDGDDFPW